MRHLFFNVTCGAFACHIFIWSFLDVCSVRVRDHNPLPGPGCVNFLVHFWWPKIWDSFPHSAKTSSIAEWFFSFVVQKILLSFPLFHFTNVKYPKAYFSIGLRSRISWSQRDFLLSGTIPVPLWVLAEDEDKNKFWLGGLKCMHTIVIHTFSLNLQ